MPFVQGRIGSGGNLDAKIGAGGQKCKMNDDACVTVFNRAGMPAVFEPNMLLWLRSHVPLCVAFESVSVAAVRRGGGASWNESLTIARGMHESFTLIQRLGYEIYPAGKSRLRACPSWIVAAMLWFVSRIPSFRELLATGAAECRALVDVLVASVPRADPPINVSRLVAMKPSLN